MASSSIFDDSLDQSLAELFGLVLKIGRDVNDIPLSAKVLVDFQISAFISMRSTTPAKSFSAPIGSCNDQVLHPGAP
jgi:hypothetical protein